MTLLSALRSLRNYDMSIEYRQAKWQAGPRWFVKAYRWDIDDYGLVADVEGPSLFAALRACLKAIRGRK